MLTEKPLRVLIVDDEPDIISVLKEGLKLKGFEVDGFTDPRKALEQFKPNSYDIVVSDIKMPHINGFQLCRKIKEKEARESTSSVPLIYTQKKQKRYSLRSARRFSSGSRFDIKSWRQY